MRFAAALVAALGALAAVALAQAPVGRAVRVEAPRRVEVFVPAGRFTMGVAEDAVDWAVQQCDIAFPSPTLVLRATGAPVAFCSIDYKGELEAMAWREVYLDAYAIDRDEVTAADYRRCLAAGSCDLAPLVVGGGRYVRDEWPLVNVTWTEAQDYCRWRGARLPTEAEWERAARGDDPVTVWPWGAAEAPKDFNHGQARAPAIQTIDKGPSIPPVAYLGDPDDTDGAALLAPAGEYSWGESPFHTRDQAGNVAEWTADAWSAQDNAIGYRGLSSTNPLREGPLGTAAPRVVRGGSWRQPAFLGRSDLRDPYNQLYISDMRFSHIGFRCARAL